MSRIEINVLEASKELTKRERVQLKDTGAMTQLREMIGKTIAPEAYARIAVHNERARGDQDYEQLVIWGKDGVQYVTGSGTFAQKFLDIAEEMEGEEFEILVKEQASRNYPGKTFLTCNLI